MAKTIITLGREYCTGGRYIAKDVARALGIKLYDKELITMAAKNSGLSEEAVAASEKRHTHSLLYSLYTMGNDLPLGDQVSSCRAASSSSWPTKAPASSWAAAATMSCATAKTCCASSSTPPRSGVWLTARRTTCCRPRTKRHQGRDRQDRPQPCRLLQLLHPEPLGRCPQL